MDPPTCALLTRTNHVFLPQAPPASGDEKAKAAAIVIVTHPDTAEKTKTILSGLSFAYPDAKVIGGVAGKASPDHGAGVFMFPSIKVTSLRV